MTTDLTNISHTLAELTDIELHALIVATNEVPPIAYGLLVWIEGACDWELSRRAGREYELLPPEAAIDPSEDAISIEANYALRASFATSGFAPATLKFFDALAELLTGTGELHQRGFGGREI